MSANRSVLAAQRRRAGPTNAEPNIPGRGPQPSINSSQVFANQGKTQQGRFSGQQQQQQQQQQQEGLSSVNKMTIPQAITLITLRLGVVESKLIHLQEAGFTNNMHFEGPENMTLVDKNVIESISSRLESLEQRNGGSSSNGPEVSLLKQQIETIKQAVIKSTATTNALTKENKDLKTQMQQLKNELTETKDLLHALQSLTMDNSQKLLDIASGHVEYYNEVDGEGTNLTNLTDLHDLTDDVNSNEIVETNLKELIENEINGVM